MHSNPSLITRPRTASLLVRAGMDSREFGEGVGWD
jgi:hypothetical protein